MRQIARHRDTRPAASGPGPAPSAPRKPARAMAVPAAVAGAPLPLATLLALAAALILLLAGSAAASLPPAGDAADDTSYGYLRTVEGPGTVVQASSGARIGLEANYPVLAGDRLEVDPGGRLELSLPDFNVVRLASGSELLLDRLALSADTGDDETALRLLRGELQLLVHDLLPVAERPRVDTANATIYLQGTGVYRIATDGYGWTEVVVRRGFAEIATENGSSVVRGGEQAWVEGGRWPRIGIERAGGLNDLERWGADLDGELTAYGEPPVEDHLAYSAAPLERHGSWVDDGGYRAWRPAVGAGWRPYEDGYWAETPTGMYWVSSEPWASVTYHYGSWVPSSSFGWVWRPGYSFAPAWVYWYWGPSYVAWVPVGYYSRHYGHYGRGFRFGVHGWAGGSVGYFADWTFCSTRSYRRRDLRRHVRRGHQLARDTRSFALERGLISTDSRPEALARAARSGAVRGRAGDRELPDVTAFVARRRELPPEVSERVFARQRAVGRDEVWERDDRAPITRRGESSSGTRVAVPRAETRPRGDDWRSQSGRLRTGDGDPRATGPRARPAGPGAEGSRWWEDRPGRAAPRGATPAPGGARATPTRPGDARGDGEARPPVVRRVWEGIRDRQRARPGGPGSSAGPSAPDRREPSAQPRSVPQRRAPATQPRSAPQRRTPSAQPRSTPQRRPPSAEPRQSPQRRAPEAQRRTPEARGSSAPPRRSSSAQRRSEPPRRSSAEGRSTPSRRAPEARSGSRGSSRSSASSSRGGSSRRSSESSRGKSARRKPPA